jgi:hypothetical protein
MKLKDLTAATSFAASTLDPRIPIFTAVANPKSRREFLTGASSTLTLPRGAVAVLSADAMLLASLSPWERQIVEQAMANHPAVSPAKCIEMLRAFGM